MMRWCSTFSHPGRQLAGNPGRPPEKTAVCSSRRLLEIVISLIAASGLIILGSCGSTASLVKNDTDRGPSLGSNLIAKAHKFGSGEKPAASSKASAYPPLPLEADGARVRRFVREYAYEQRETTKQYLARAQEHLPMVSQIADENGLPRDLACLFLLESGANPEARSPANALGMWQFMPATARSYGLRVDSRVDERLDPEKSTKAAMLYLKDLYGMFGCWRLAVSAYNSGENKLNKVLCQEDAKEYDEICSSRRLRRETREFWPRFQALAQIAKDPAKYGFAPLRLKAYQRNYGLVTTESSYSLVRLAQLAGVSEQKLAEMNPSLLRGMTPDNGPSFSLKVPLDKRDVLVASLKDAPSEPPRSQIVHVVNRGDSLGRILKRYQVSKSQLAGVNPDVNLGRRLPKGVKIVIPVEKKEPRARARLGDRA